MATPIVHEVSTPAYVREITYSRKTRDYEMRLDGETVGYANTYRDAEVTLDQLVHSLLSHPQSVADAIIDRLETEATSADMVADAAEMEDQSISALVIESIGECEICTAFSTHLIEDTCPTCRVLLTHEVGGFHAAICQGCGKDRQLVYGYCAWCRLLTRTTDAQYCEVA